LNAINLYQPDQDWTDGPIVTLDYRYQAAGAVPHGKGRITISEFKPRGIVTQLVALDSVRKIQIGPKGNISALLINGQWVRTDHGSRVWDNNKLVDLIFERDGVIFWITGDPRDGIDGDALLK